MNYKRTKEFNHNGLIGSKNIIGNEINHESKLGTMIRVVPSTRPCIERIVNQVISSGNRNLVPYDNIIRAFS